MVLGCFFYIGALNETIGYSTRIATFMFKASRSTTDADAFELKGGFNSSFPIRQKGRHSQMSGPQSALIVAKFSDVTVKNPANVTLIRDLTMQVTLHNVTFTRCFWYFYCPNPIFLQIYTGQGCLISGPSGCGKSSLLRVIGRLWPAAGGSVEIPQHIGRDGVFFLPQRMLCKCYEHCRNFVTSCQDPI